MNKEDLLTLWQKEKEFIGQEKKRNPELFLRPPMIDGPEILKLVGISGIGQGAPIGYLKLWPQDFIVEEIDKGGGTHTIDPGPLFQQQAPSFLEEGLTVYADLVKVGISTVDAIEELSGQLHIDPKAIGTAGIKDRDAITSQQISFRNIEEEQLASLNLPNLFLKNIRRGKGVVEKGGLFGNRFAIAVRTPEDLDRDALRSFFANASKAGFFNFFYLQRFGTPRLITHLLGLLLLQGNYEEVVKTFFTYPGIREIPYFIKVRQELGRNWGNWRAMKEIVAPFHYSFRQEFALLDYLEQHPSDFIGALQLMPQQVTLGAYAYSSYLFNRVLSAYIKAGREPPATLPIALSKYPEDRQPYQRLFEADEVYFPSPAFRDFPFVQMRKAILPTRVHPDVHGWLIKDRMAVVQFTLPKGAYATTFLAHAFRLATGVPIPEGIPTEPVDTLSLLGRGRTIIPVTERFSEAIVSKLEEGQTIALDENA